MPPKQMTLPQCCEKSPVPFKSFRQLRLAISQMTAAAAAAAFATNCKSIKSKLIKMHLPGKNRDVAEAKNQHSNVPTFETFIDTFAMFTLDNIDTITAPRSHGLTVRVLASRLRSKRTWLQLRICQSKIGRCQLTNIGHMLRSILGLNCTTIEMPLETPGLSKGSNGITS